MKVVINEASRYKMVPALEDAAGIYWQFYQTYAALKRAESIAGFRSLYGRRIIITEVVAADGSKISDLQKIWGAQYKGRGRTAFSALLSALGKVIPINEEEFPIKEVCLDQISFGIPEDHVNSVLFSLITLPKYEEICLQGHGADGSIIELKNISHPSHIEEHRVVLGIRRYERNEKHKTNYSPMGKGRIASPMDLDDEVAQKLLNRAIYIDKERTLYGALNGKCYVFPEHERRKAVYHGYIEDRPSEKVRKALGLK